MDHIKSSNEVLAKYFDAFVKKAGIALQEGAQDIKTGTIRLMTVIPPVYNSDPQLLSLMIAYSDMVRAEDLRVIYSIKSLILKPHVIYEMTLAIVIFIFLKIP